MKDRLPIPIHILIITQNLANTFGFGLLKFASASGRELRPRPYISGRCPCTPTEGSVPGPTKVGLVEHSLEKNTIQLGSHL